MTEEDAQEIVDHFVMKLRMIKFARTPEYQELYSGDPQWVTEAIAGMAHDGRSMVTKSSFRFLNTLTNLGAAPEPNLTVLWSTKLPEGFKKYCAKMSIETSAIQYENDDIMSLEWGDDYGIACCVSAMRIGKQMQFFGARANLAKTLLYAINGGVDETKKKQVGPKLQPITSEYLDYDEVAEKFDVMMDWIVALYVNTLNVIHYMHDKYSYESLEMALHDTHVVRTLATGVAGFSVTIDSLSAIKYAKVKPIRDENGIAIDFEIEGDFPKYGNNDDRADQIGIDLLKQYMGKVKKQTWFTARKLVARQTDVKPANHSHLVLTQCTEEIHTALWQACLQLLRSLTNIHWTVSPIHSRSSLKHWDAKRKYKKTTLQQCWMDTSLKVAIT